MSTPPVHWHEGLFLRPHHFQAAERFVLDQNRIGDRFDLHHNWGVRHLEIDRGALKNYRFVVRRLEARMRDGTLVVLGADHSLAELDLRPMEKQTLGTMVDVLLAAPKLQIGRENATKDAPESRFHIDAPREPLPDENSGQNPRPVQFRRLNLKLLTADANLSGYDTLPIARLERSAEAGAPPKLHEWYIPPLLACDGWEPLSIGVLGQIYNSVGNRTRQIAKDVKDQRITFDSNSADDRKMFERLRALNEAFATLHLYALSPGIHPFTAYLELLRLAGRFAVFAPGCTLPDDMPVYDHDDLGKCFYWVKRFIDELLDQVQQGYEMKPFVGSGLRMGVAIKPEWLAPAAQTFIGVVCDGIPREHCRRLLTGRLNMKVGAAERVEEIYERGLLGLEFLHVAEPPRVLPTAENRLYFQINRDTSKDEWAAVAQTYNLAIRMNKEMILGVISGREDVSISIDGRTATMRFTLYVIPPTLSRS